MLPKGQKEIDEVHNVNSEKLQSNPLRTRQQKYRDQYDGSEPLDFPAHEAVAQHLSTPKSLRRFKSDFGLAKHFQVTRMTVHRWKHELDVMQRAYWLSMTNKLAGELAVRVE